MSECVDTVFVIEYVTTDGQSGLEQVCDSRKTAEEDAYEMALEMADTHEGSVEIESHRRNPDAIKGFTLYVMGQIATTFYVRETDFCIQGDGQ